MSKADPTIAARAKRLKKAKKESGEVQVTVWIPAEKRQQLLAIAALMRDGSL